MGGTGTVDVTGGQAAMTAGESETVTDRGGGVVMAGGEAMHTAQMVNGPSREATARAGNNDHKGAGLQSSDELEVAGVSTLVREGDDVIPEIKTTRC